MDTEGRGRCTARVDISTVVSAPSTCLDTQEALSPTITVSPRVGVWGTHPSMKARPAAAPSPTGKEHSTASSVATGATAKPKNPKREQAAASARRCPGSRHTWGEGGGSMRHVDHPNTQTHCRAEALSRDSYQCNGHACHGGQAEAHLDSLSEVPGPVHIEAQT